jgi:2-oxoglutarate ferredoxin oxidoreductase subunit alpha
VTRAKAGTYLWQGNEACAEGAISAGCRFFAGYPITPSSEVAEYLARRLPQEGGRFIQMEDEIASIGAIIGASMVGTKSMTATSGPGFSLMQENIGYACITEIPCVILNVMRVGPSTGQPTGTSQGDFMQIRWGTHGDHEMIALAPASAQEMFDMTVKAFNLSEKYRNPVVVASEAVVAHIREKVIVPDRIDIEIRPVYDISQNHVPLHHPGADLVARSPNIGTGLRPHFTGLVHTEEGFFTSSAALIEEQIRRICDKITLHADEIADWEEEATEGAKFLIVSYGVTARSGLSVVRRLRTQGVPIGYLRAKVIWPMPERRISELAEQVDVIFVPEMNLGQMKLEVERLAAGKAKVVGINRVGGEIMGVGVIYDAVKEVIGA